MKKIDFTNGGIRILGIFHTLNKSLHIKNNFERVLLNFTTTLSIWRSRNLTLYGKIQILKSLALPKLYYICNNLHVEEEFITLVENVMKDFIWNGRKPKIKSTTLIGDYCDGGLRLPHFGSHIKANRIKWAIRLLSSERKTWKYIPSKYIKRIGGISNICYVNFDTCRIPSDIPPFYNNILTNWAEITCKDIAHDLENLNVQYLWNNRHIKIEKKSLYVEKFAKKGINYVVDLCDKWGSFTWEHALSKGLNSDDKFKWFQLVQSIPKEWKTKLKDEKSDKQRNISKTLILRDKKIECVKIKQKDVYSHLVNKLCIAPTAQTNWAKKINQTIDWRKVYVRIYRTTIDSYLRYFQYKIVNNILYLNRDLYRFHKVVSPSCSYCLHHLETIEHLFVECIHAKNLYFEMQDWLKKYELEIPVLSIDVAILGVDDLSINTILLFFKLMLYINRGKRSLTLPLFQNLLRYYEKIEFQIAQEKNLMSNHLNKWSKINKALYINRTL